MATALDPEGVETRVIHDLVDFRGRGVLEIGCGDGRLTWRYADDAASVLAIDPKEARIAQAQEHTSDALRDTVTFKAVDISTFEPPEAAFDIALFSWSI
ncbi:MAG: class I SAM-dependent methyltransferase [Dehalococcoidia bacterium]